MNISQRFKLIRETLGLTQTLMAQDLGIDRSHVGNIENASKKASDSLLKHICARYGVSESWLKTGEGEMFTSPEDRMKKLLEQLNSQPSVHSYYSFLVDHRLPLQESLPHHLQIQADLLEQRKEAIREELEVRLEKQKQATDISAENISSFVQQILPGEADEKELEEMKNILEILFNASPSYREWAKIQFKYAFPETILAQARTQLQQQKLKNDKK
ncbi:helix-turn-helix domain-containing protein [Desulforamulus ruminis]|uniref:Helix-turn-helix domain protein n=1 Tax=Desulforamulus ruminis (strain ATCC 23193 / DSM 2154 / NCIMB 8452 / DL) TaxID=696281 RepID=F6DQY5_DESRL|nr:helix-turn-helix transcriptional regulator [Desulforamulus ruminis]AEG58709.1 helix-turn-helix domain protein [Desulforamulus ruminis DSM 2154]